MRIKKSVNVMACLLVVMSVLVLSVYGADASGTYTDTLTEGANETNFHVNDGYFVCTDYLIYYVTLNETQDIEVTLEVPEEADFDLLVCTEDEQQFWCSITDGYGTTEELNITVPETGVYKLIATCWKGTGEFTLDWQTVEEGSAGLQSIPPIFVIGLIVTIIVIVVAVILLMRRKSHVPAPPQSYVPPPAPTTT